MTFEEWMGAGYSDRMTGMEALRAAYEAGRKAGIEEARCAPPTVFPSDQLPRRLNVLEGEYTMLRDALEQALDDMGDSLCVCQATKELMLIALSPPEKNR